MTDVNIIVLVGQLILTGVMVYIAMRKAPAERLGIDATTAAGYAQAAKLKQEENAMLQREIDDVRARLDAVENKKYKVCIEFITGDPPEVLKAEIAQVMPGADPINLPKKSVEVKLSKIQ
jgi:hypothetical protein